MIAVGVGDVDMDMPVGGIPLSPQASILLGQRPKCLRS